MQFILSISSSNCFLDVDLEIVADIKQESVVIVIIQKLDF